MATLTYNPAIFRVQSMDAARAIILTPDGGQTTDERWTRETPHLTDILGQALAPAPGQLIVDFGCGVGRMSKALIERYGCQVLGVDLSPDMRAFAPGYVGSQDFSVVSGEVFRGLVDKGLRIDGAISVWVLQHCLSPAEDIALLDRALKPGGRVGVVNTYVRVVPTVEKTWASDGADVPAILARTFDKLDEGKLDETVVGALIRNATFWGAYAKRA